MNIKNSLLLLPAAGVLVFFTLYIIATFYYPGGSDVDPGRIGFDWVNNYWCDLTDQITESGAINPARPIALIAMLVLTISIAMLAYIIPAFFANLKLSFLIRYLGIAAMIAANFVFTEFHSNAAYIAGMLGIIPLALAYYGLYKNKYTELFVFGIISMFFLALNFFVYRTRIYIEVLPLVQKFTFLAFLIWIFLLDIKVYNSLKNKNVQLKK